MQSFVRRESPFSPPEDVYEVEQLTLRVVGSQALPDPIDLHAYAVLLSQFLRSVDAHEPVLQEDQSL